MRLSERKNGARGGGGSERKLVFDHRQQRPPIRSGAREDGDKAGETDGDEAALMSGRLRRSELLLE